MYNKTDKNYLGEGIDSSNNPFDSFQVEDEMHIVYNIGSEKELVNVRKIKDIKHNMDEFLWTPFIDNIHKTI